MDNQENMAEGFDRNRVVSLLQEATRLIADTERSATNSNSGSSTQRTAQETQSSSNTRFMCYAQHIYWNQQHKQSAG